MIVKNFLDGKLYLSNSHNGHVEFDVSSFVKKILLLGQNNRGASQKCIKSLAKLTSLINKKSASQKNYMDKKIFYCEQKSISLQMGKYSNRNIDGPVMLWLEYEWGH